MAQQSKVVSLREAQGPRVELPPALIRLRDASARTLSTVMSEFFDSADDVLFGMADRAGSNQDQIAYFDAMRELRLRRKAMTNTMLGWVARAFNEIGRFDPMPRSRGLEEVDQDSLSLLDDGELEQKVAIDSLINKLATRYAEPVRLLSVRFAHVSGHRELADRQMPLSPEVICTGLGEASGELDIDIRARLVVLKLFDRLLVDRLSSLYQDANHLLVAEGVLPDLKRPPAATPQNRAAPGRSVPPSRSGGATNTGVTGADRAEGESSVTFSELTALLHGSDGGQAGSGHGVSQGASGAGELGTGDLMSQLGGLQGSAMTSENGQVVPLSELLARALNRGPGRSLPVNQVDGDVINLVAMLFEFILDDRQLPAVMKMLIGRLQIPVVKVALIDRSFFNRGGHPARKLLNELAMAGIGWTPRGDNQRDPLKEKVESVVERLLNEFTDNVGLFDELLKDFQHFMDLDRRRRELVEQRLRDAEEGRARHELAREKIRTLLDGLLETYDVPDRARAIVNEPWRKYLEWLFLREGEKSVAWQEATDLTIRLAWSLDPQPVEESTRDDLLKAIPGITDALRNGLHEISWDPFAIDAAIRDLELAHVDVLQGLVTRPPQTPPEEELPSGPADEVAADPLPENAGADMAPVAEPDQPATLKADEAPQTSDPVTEPAVAKAGTTEVPEKPAETAPATAAGEPDPVWMEKAAGLRVGCWMEMPRDNGRLRCKLAAIIRATGKYIFVNRNGAKVAEYLQGELAQTLSEGKITLLDDGLIFDRALESIIDNLRHNRRD
ncbi:DUF1631 domain-containing protein [Marinobacter zhanjiangensis]|uniref:Thymidine phosphorylase n=1 Tax=Marinobacter zhanjiangensis TaxID=578215 RepID=A0ABQ3AR04_9GAMM|nr:DUF1631 domain-containing protein [Marinobacter zhanjiangensis]GGY65146.1 hypothetical protein GCM10007071_09860 [Marinobacter zhanjiangensis]